jgi:hypothetical protein
MIGTPAMIEEESGNARQFVIEEASLPFMLLGDLDNFSFVFNR